MRSDLPHLVIVGAGFGGLHAALALSGADVRITIIDRRNHHLFQPLLYQVATASLAPADITYPIRGILRRQKNTQVFLAEAVAIDVGGRRLILQDGEISYDYLILATGVRHSYFGHPEWEDYAPGLKSVDDALAIRRRILLAFERAEREPDAAKRRALLTFVVVGGGPTGVELAGAIAEIASMVLTPEFCTANSQEARIILVEAGPRVLPSFHGELSEKAEASLRRLCVEVRTKSRVSAIGPDGVVICDERISAATVLWAAGVTASPLARSLGVPTDPAGRVLVEPDLSIPGHPEVFVIGDLAAFPHPRGPSLPGLAPVAVQEGQHAARNVLRQCHGVSTEPFHYRNRGALATIGRSVAVGQFGPFKLSGFLAWVVWAFLHIFFLVGFRNRFVVLFEWAWAYATMQYSARLITGSGARPDSSQSNATGDPGSRRGSV